jgi:hypothetical protein
MPRKQAKTTSEPAPAAVPSSPVITPEIVAAFLRERDSPIRLHGRTIIGVRLMTAGEMADQGWAGGRNAAPLVLILDNGIKLFPASDCRGNGPGALYGFDAYGEFQLEPRNCK